MKVIPACHDRNRCALQGPFSPFTFALQDIRNKLITRRDHHEAGNDGRGDGFTQVDHEYLRHIISICIPLYTSKDLTEAYITFPIAACYRNGSEEQLLYYSGEYDRPAQATEGLEPDEIKEVREVIKHYIVSTKDALDDRIRSVELKDIIEIAPTIPTIPTQYPQSLRTIQGFFKAMSSDRVFYVFFSCQPVDETRTGALGGSSEGSSLCNLPLSPLTACASPKSHVLQIAINNCCQAAIDDFRKYFMSPDVRRDLDSILVNVKKIRSYSEADDKSQNAHKPDTHGTYNLLRDILSNIQADAVKLIRLQDNEDFQERKRRAFSVVFVLPYLDSDRQLNFRYILTHEQIQLLRDLSKSGQFQKLIENMEKGSFESLMGEVEKSIGEKLQIKREEFSPKPDFRELVERLKKNVTFDENKDVVRDRDGLSRQVEEYLRTAIFLNYAFQGPTKDKVLSEPDLAAYMASDRSSIRYGQAFLLDEIFRAKRPDVMFSMVNHPFSKLRQCPTQQLINAYEGNYTDEMLYPAGLNLLEALFLPQPLFLYPIYQYEAPILLCAFDATLYSGSWQALKSMVDAHTEGIFSAIVSHELDESKKFFNESYNITSMSIPGAMDELAERLTYLLLRFCPSLYYLNKALKEEEKLLRVLDHAMTGERVTKIDYDDKEGNASIPIRGFAKKVTVLLDLITQSEDGRCLLQYYVELCINSFLGIWKVAELSKSEEAKSQTLRWAHAIKTELGEISMVSELIAPTGEPTSNEPNISSYIESLKTQVYILTNSVESLKNRVNALQLSASTNINNYIQAEASKEDFCCVMFDTLQIALLNLLLSTKRECSDKRSRWFKAKFIRGNSSYNNEEFGMVLRNISLLKYKEDDSVSELISQMNIIFNRNNHNQEECPLKIAASSFFKFSIPSSEYKYYPNILVIILSEVIFNALKYTSKDVKIDIEENNSYNFISVKNPFSREKSRTNIGLSLVKTMSERVLRKNELSEFTYGNNGEKVWIFKMPVYKCKSKQADKWG